MTPPGRIHLPRAASLPLMTVIYALSAGTLGLSAFPSALLVLWGARQFLLDPLLARAAPAAGPVLLFCLAAGLGLYLFFFCGLLLMGLLLRGLSFVLRPGRHKLHSVTTVFWIAANYVQTLALRVILPVVPGGWLPTMYLRLAGCSIGRDVWITGATILDPWLVSIGDGTVIGGDVMISARTAGSADLYLGPITIGKDCRIGAHAVICAGVTLGDGAAVGVHAYIRTGRRIPPGAQVAAVGGLPPRDVLAMERHKW